MALRPKPGAFRVLPERNLRDDDPTSTRVGLSQTEDRGPALACPLLQGRLINSTTVGKVTTPHVVVLAGGQIVVPHKLGRAIVGWFVVRNGGGGFVGQALPIELAADASFLTLGNPGAVDLSFDLWVF
jgi:hypothetical protein